MKRDEPMIYSELIAKIMHEHSIVLKVNAVTVIEAGEKRV